MKPKEIQELIDYIAKSGLDEVNIETDQFKISVRRSATIKQAETIISQIAQPQPIFPLNTNTQTSQNTSQQPIVEANTTNTSSNNVSDNSNYITVKSPMIGTFYRSANPDSPVFASVGDEIKNGQVICIIEAMKLFNEIESEISGRIVKVLVENASPVEYDQPLFLVDPN